MPACPLLTLRRHPRERPTHNSGSWLIAIHYHVEDLHLLLLLFAGFYRRFLGVPLYPAVPLYPVIIIFQQGSRRDIPPKLSALKCSGKLS